VRLLLRVTVTKKENTLPRGATQRADGTYSSSVIHRIMTKQGIPYYQGLYPTQHFQILSPWNYAIFSRRDKETQYLEVPDGPPFHLTWLYRKYTLLPYCCADRAQSNERLQVHTRAGFYGLLQKDSETRQIISSPEMTKMKLRGHKIKTSYGIREPHLVSSMMSCWILQPNWTFSS
jgi:hypothetical protein